MCTPEACTCWGTQDSCSRGTQSLIWAASLCRACAALAMVAAGSCIVRPKIEATAAFKLLPQPRPPGKQHDTLNDNRNQKSTSAHKHNAQRSHNYSIQADAQRHRFSFTSR